MFLSLFLSGFLIRVRGQVRVSDVLGDGFSVRVRERTTLGLGEDWVLSITAGICLGGIFGKKQKASDLNWKFHNLIPRQ